MPDKAPAHKLPFLKGGRGRSLAEELGNGRRSPPRLSHPQKPRAEEEGREGLFTLSPTLAEEGTIIFNTRAASLSRLPPFPTSLFRLSFALESSLLSNLPFPLRGHEAPEMPCWASLAFDDEIVALSSDWNLLDGGGIGVPKPHAAATGRGLRRQTTDCRGPPPHGRPGKRGSCRAFGLER